MTFVCSARGVFGRVIHDRLGVYDPVVTIKEDVLSLSHFVALRQWSAATDLYSIGAIFLYTLFSYGVQNHGLPKSKEVSNRGIDALSENWARTSTNSSTPAPSIRIRPSKTGHRPARHAVRKTPEGPRGALVKSSIQIITYRKGQKRAFPTRERLPGGLGSPATRQPGTYDARRLSILIPRPEDSCDKGTGGGPTRNLDLLEKRLNKLSVFIGAGRGQRSLSGTDFTKLLQRFAWNFL